MSGTVACYLSLLFFVRVITVFSVTERPYLVDEFVQCFLYQMYNKYCITLHGVVFCFVML